MPDCQDAQQMVDDYKTAHNGEPPPYEWYIENISEECQNVVCPPIPPPPPPPIP